MKQHRNSAQPFLIASLVFVGTFHGGFASAAGVAAPEAASSSSVPQGATPVQVEEALGKPKGRLLVGGLTIWSYPQGEVEFRSGFVSRVQWRKPAPAPEPPAVTNPPAAATPGADTDHPRQRAENLARRKSHLADRVTRDARAPAETAADKPSLPRELAGPVSWLTYGNNERNRREAADKLATLADPRTWDPLSNALIDGDEGVRSRAFEALRRIDPERALDALAAIALRHSNATCRCNAINLLQKTGHPRAVAVLIQALDDSDDQNRTMAACALVALRETALPELQAAARRPDPVMRRNAVFALGRFGQTTETPLIEALADADPGVRRNAVFALSQFGQRAETPLLKALGDPDAGVRVDAVGALQYGTSDRSKAAVRLLLSDPDASVRRAAEIWVKASERLAEEERIRRIESQKEQESRRIAEARERSEKRRQAAIGLAALCLSGLLALLFVFRVQVFSEPPPLPLFSRVLCLASALSLCAAVIMLLVQFYPSSLSGIHVDAWLLVFIFSVCASFTVMKCLRGAWKRADEALAGKMPGDADSRLLVDGLLFLALAICLGSVGYLHLRHWQIGMAALTTALVIPCLIQAATNLSQWRRIHPTVQRLLQNDLDPEDIPERPMGVTLCSLLALGVGFALITIGYIGITSVIPHMFDNSESSGLELFVGGLAILLGLPALCAGQGTYLLEESGRRLLVRFYALCCVGPLVPLAILALLYLTSFAVKEKFRYDIREKDEWDKARSLENKARGAFGGWYGRWSSNE